LNCDQPATAKTPNFATLPEQNIPYPD